MNSLASREVNLTHYSGMKSNISSGNENSSNHARKEKMLKHFTIALLHLEF